MRDSTNPSSPLGEILAEFEEKYGRPATRQEVAEAMDSLGCSAEYAKPKNERDPEIMARSWS